MSIRDLMREFVRSHPGATVLDIERGVPSLGESCAFWFFMVALENEGSVEAKKEEYGWKFYPKVQADIR